MDAKWAYQFLFGNTKFDIATQLTDLMKGGYLDFQTGATAAASTSAVDPLFRPLVRTHQFQQLDTLSNEVMDTFTVCVIDNPISPAFKERYVQSLDKLLFTKGQGGKEKAFIRNVCSMTGEASLVIAGKHVYKAIPSTVIEQMIIDIANHIVAYQRRVIESTCGKNGFKVTFHCNLLHTVVAAIRDAVYSWHSDKSTLLCSADDEYCHVTEDLWLPRQNEMQIMSLVLSNSMDQFSTGLEYRTDPERGTTVKQIGKGSSVVKLGSCCLHFQGAGSQSPGLKHRSFVLPECNPGGSIWRCVSTMRFTLDPDGSAESHKQVEKRILHDLSQEKQTREPITKYNVTNALSTCVSYGDVVYEDGGDQDTDSMASDTKTNRDVAPSRASVVVNPSLNTRKRPHSKVGEREVEFPYINLSSPEYSDLYPTIPKNEYSAMGLYQPGPTVRLSGSMSSELGAAPMLKELFDQGYLVEIETSKLGSKIPLLHEFPRNDGPGMQFPIPGRLYKLSNITADAGLIHTDQAHPIFSRGDNNHRIMVLSKPYKNDAGPIVAFGQNAKNWYKDKDDDCLLFKNGFTGKITIHGSGGSPTVAGAHPPSAKSSTVGDASVLIPPNQDMHCVINVGLIDMCAMDEVFTLYYNEGLFSCGSDDARADAGHTGEGGTVASFGPATKRARVEVEEADKTMVRCLGTFSITSLLITSEKDDEVISKHGDLPQEQQMFHRYLGVRHIEATLSPLMTNHGLSKMKKQHRTMYREDFKMVTIPYACNDHIEIDVGIGDEKAAASLNRQKMLTRRKVLKGFIANGGLRKYMSLEDQHKEADGESDVLEHLSGGEEFAVGGEVTDESEVTVVTDAARSIVLVVDCITDSTKGVASCTACVTVDQEGEKRRQVVQKSKVGEGVSILSDGEGVTVGFIAAGSVGVVDGGTEVTSVKDATKSRALDGGTEVTSVKDATKSMALDGHGIEDGTEEDKSDGVTIKGKGRSLPVKGVKENSQEEIKNAQKGVIASIPDIFDAVLLNSYCGALRYAKRECLSEKEGVMFAKPLDDETLPVLFRTHSLPMPNRALDVVAYGQRRAAYQSGLFETFQAERSSRIKFRGADGTTRPTSVQAQALIDTVFKSLMIRFTGRLNPFQLYSLHKGKGFLLPGVANADEFLRFMKSTFQEGKTGNRTLGQWLTTQHEGSIPSTTKNYTGFVSFIGAVCGHLPGTVTEMLQDGDDAAIRSVAVDTLSSMLLTCCKGDTSGHLQFMAQLIVADVEELFDDPFGKVTSKGIVAGQGGKQGHDMLQKAGGAKKLEDAINSIIKYVTETATSEQLEIAGYKRDGEGIVVNLVNGRPFNASDAEHFLCKAWMIGKLTLAHYNTKFPRPTRPHCHPVKLTKDENPECTEVDIVMLGITAAFQAQMKLLKTPNFCLSKRELMPELG